MPEPLVDPTWLRRIAREEGFQPDSFERAWRLAHLLGEIARVPYLAERLVLKGGTAINFFHADLPRLSVDIDVNYIGAVEREAMLADRPKVKETFRALAKTLRYEVDEVFEEHAGWGVRFLYRNAHGSRDAIKVDANFLSRLNLFPAETRNLPPVFEIDAPAVRVLGTEEGFGGKLTALVTRGEPRDVFDAAHLFEREPDCDPSKLRKAFLFFAHLDDATLQTANLDRLSTLDERAFNDRLRPLLRRSVNIDGRALVGRILPRVRGMLSLTKEERRFGEELESGSFQPQLLFGSVPVNPRIAEHPAAEWRRRNPHSRAVLEGR